ncbi:hypothetical protein [Hydrogenophaga sp.]|uniref:hypothetical protein n=1 Tax=Hydrogenophaga sp. TaxID=1904254 RepID=UPI002FC92667
MGAVEMTSAVADVVTAAATLGAVIVAGFGLQAWKKELKGRAEFDTARMLAKDAYALREALSGYRSPLWSSGEFPGGDMKSVEGLAAMFQNRWRPLSEALAKFDSSVLEAEALWGSTSRQQTDRLRRCVIKVFVATEALLDDKRADGEHFKADPQFGQRIRSEVAGSLDSDTNAMSSEIRASVKAIEDMLKPHLSRN